MPDLEKIISDSIADLPGSDASTGSGEPDTTETEAPDVTEDPTEALAAETATETEAQETETELEARKPADVDDDLLSTEFKGNKNNRIPYTRVKAIADNAVKKATEPLTAKIKEYEAAHAQVQTQLAGMQLIDDDPERFLSALAQADPRYAKLLSGASESTATHGTVARPNVSEKPKPNIQLEDGRRVYDAEGQEALAEWVAQQRVADVEKRYAEEYGPIAQDYKVGKLKQNALVKVQSQLEVASKWPGFADPANQKAIAAAMTTNKNLSLEQAYIQVVLPKLQATNDSALQRSIAEANKKARAASTPGAAAAAPVQRTGPRDTEDIIREQVAKLKK